MIKIKGIEDIQEKIEQLGDTSRIEDALKTACALVEREAKETAPKDSGTLRRSITSKIEGTGTDLEGVVFTPVEYAPYVEYGTGLFAENGGRSDVPWRYQDEKGEWVQTCGQPPQPFMRPALDNNREKIISILQEGLKND